MSCEDLENKFNEFLLVYSNKENIDIEYALNELLELSDRQWHTYEVLNNNIKIKIEDFLNYNLNFKNEDIIDTILCIVPRLGLTSVFNNIIKNKNKIINTAILKLVEEAELEYGSTVDNPYSSLQNHLN